MNQRLHAIYQLILPSRGMIDVGTDHGYIPVQLAKGGYPGQILASDIREGPLEAAKRSAENAGVVDRIRFLLCDGLEQCPQNAVDTIVIAGMGGDTICGILDRAEWCMSPEYKLILQPMTKQEVLRYWLVNNGFQLDRELLVKDRGILYQILETHFSGENESLNDAELFVGKYALSCQQPLFGDLLDLECRRVETVLAAKRIDDPGSDSFLNNIYTELLSMRNDLHG